MGNSELGARTEQKPVGLTEIGTPMKESVNRFRILEEKEKRFRPDVYWYLTFRCNLACAHCSVRSSPWVDTSQDLTTEECMQVIDQMAALNVKTALMTGGEFLIRPDALAILKELERRGIKIGLESNGVSFPKGFPELARELQDKQMFNMTISLDGGTKETHERLRGPKSFDRTVRNFHRLKEAGVKFHIQCVLNKSNFGTIPNLYELASEFHPNCMVVQFAILNPVGRGSKLIKDLGLGSEEIPKIFRLVSEGKETYPGYTLVKMPPAMVPPQYLPMVFNQPKVASSTSCQFPLLGVLPNGDVSICALSRDNDGLHFGNIRNPEVNLKSIWEKTRMSMLRSSYVGAQDLTGICGDCVWKYTCKGSCRAWAYEEGDSFDAPFPICQAMDDAGKFPNVYRLSHQNEVAARKFQEMSMSCSCSA